MKPCKQWSRQFSLSQIRRKIYLWLKGLLCVLFKSRVKICSCVGSQIESSRLKLAFFKFKGTQVVRESHLIAFEIYCFPTNHIFLFFCSITKYFKEQENIFLWLRVDVKICWNKHSFSSLRAASAAMHVRSALETSSLIQSVNIRVM